MFAKKPPRPRIETGRDVECDEWLPPGPAMAAMAALARHTTTTGDPSLRLAQILADTLPLSSVLIARYEDAARTRLRTVAVYRQGRPVEPFTYALAGSPCQNAIQHGQYLLRQGAADDYPECAWLREHAVDAYLGTAVSADDGVVSGIVAIASERSLPDLDGLRGVLGIFADRIAAAWEAYAELRDLRLAASVFDHSPQGIMITDAEHRIRRVNRAFVAITGWQEHEVRGRLDKMLSAGRDDEDLAAEIGEALDSVGCWIGELWSRRRDGEVFPESRTIVAVRDERNRLRHVINLISDISGEKFIAERIHRLAHYDATTELPNRVLLQDRLLHAINRAARAGGRLALLYLDLDGFKQINDVAGHAAGDELLRQVGTRLQSRLRKIDIVARIGGDEFAAVLGDVGEDRDVQAICDQLLAVVTEPYEINDRSHRVTTSIGIAIYPEDGTDVQSLLKHADTAMYQAKQGGKNRYVFFEPKMNQRAEERQQLARELRGALDRDAISLWYQPQYDLVTGRLVGVEALLRWRDDSGEMVPPTRFIRVAEDNGMMTELGAWALHEACRHAQQWRAQGLEFGRLAVNVSGRQFQDEELGATVFGALSASGLAPERLELEVSENWIMEGPYHADRQMRALADRGVSLVIDNFGLANMSMTHLKRFPVHKLKIDRSFVRDLPADDDDAAIVSAIVAMGHSLGLRVVAEGVERSDQRGFLRATGCDEAQGYLFGHPVPSDELNVLLLYTPTLAPS